MQWTHPSATPGDCWHSPFVFLTDDQCFRTEAELGRLVVPERRDRADSRPIELAFVRFRSTSERPGPPLFYLEGGPDESGALPTVQASSNFPWFMAFRALGDVVVLEQRGAGLSRPRLDSPSRWDLPLDEPGDRDRLIARARELAAADAAFWRGRGVDLAGYTSAESADDVAALARALGYEQINLYGASYGSHLALAVVKRHSPLVARAVIALVEGPDHTVKLPSNLQRALEELGRRLRDDAVWRGRVNDLTDLLNDLLERLRRRPVTLRIPDAAGELTTITVGAFDLQCAVAGGMGDIAALRALPARLAALDGGDYDWLGRFALHDRTGGFFSTMTACMDSASGASPERLARIERERPTALLADVINLPFPYITEALGIPGLGDDFRAPVHAETETLFVSGTLDGRTPVSNADEVRAGFPKSVHLVVDGMAHGGDDAAYDPPEVQQAALRFLRGETPAERLTLPFAFLPPPSA